MKIAGFDIGDQWTGIALSDPMGIVARPYKTIKTEDLFTTIQELHTKEVITKFILGHPKTLRGTISEQTKKVELVKEKLNLQFPQLTFILWDERLSSKRADTVRQAKTKEEKLQSHAIAAAFILSSYLEFARP